MSQRHINDNIHNSFNNINSFNNVWNNCTVADEKSQILAWLSPLEPHIRHHDIQSRRVDEVGDWLIQTEEYRKWFCGIRGGKSNGSALFCYGGPGVGKTYISSLVIDTLCRQAVGGNASVACFYSDFAAQEEQSPAAILGSVLKQVIGGLNEVPEAIVNAFRNREKVIGGQRLTLAEIVEFLQDISSSRSTFICIDALDECPSRYRMKLLDSLNQILQRSPGARIFLTGRPHIWVEVEKHLGRKAAIRSITPSRNDIIIFLRAKLREDPIPDAMDESLEAEIVQNIPDTVSEMFLLAFLTIETILQEPTIYRRRQRLSVMRYDLDVGDAYKATVGRIKAQGGEKARLGMAVLMWISHSRRALQIDEICHAIATPIGSNDLNNNSIPAISTLLGCCQGLVTIEKGTATVRLIHFTLQEYLGAHPDLFGRPHSTMAETCLTYLNFQHVKDLSAGPPPVPRGTPFLEYSSLYWGIHMRMDLSDRAITYTLQLLDQFESHISTKFLWESIAEKLAIREPPWFRVPDRKDFSPLHCISYFGIAEVAGILIKMKRWDVNQKDGAGMTPLILAARHGHEEVVGLLLQNKHIQPDQQDWYSGRTALSWAAGNGHDGVVGLFLEQRLSNPATGGPRWGKAARMVGVLFGGRYVNPNSSSDSGRTPLSWAAENGHEGAVRLLLKRNVIPDSSGISGRTPLSLAAENGHEGIVKLLLGLRNVNIDHPGGGYGWTPLSWAAKNGHEAIVKLLLGRKDVNPGRSSVFCQTPLLLAAGDGHEGIVKLLLGRKDVNPDSSSTDGRTPLSCAAENGHEGIVKLLLGLRDVNPDTADADCGRTPLSWAAGNGHEGIVKLLLGRKDVNPDSSSTHGRTPLSLAAENGHEGIVKQLLRLRDVNPDTADADCGRTPLSLAAENGHEGIVKLLLGLRDVKPDAADADCGRTPLSLAAENGHEGIVKLLLGRKDVNPDSSSTYGRTPLSLAAENGHEGIVKQLLGLRDVNPDSSSTHGRTPLSLAAARGHEATVRLLLGREDINPNSLDPDRWTPLSWAAANGYEGTVKLLLRRKGVNPNNYSKSGLTPLGLAIAGGYEEIVRLLLGRADVNPDTQDADYGRTPLSWAAEYGREKIVKLLLGREDVNPDSLSKSGRTPLELAVKNGHDGVAQLLQTRQRRRFR